eukprot:1165553-Pleurochrysis_carterae.AAC.2
MPEHGLPETIHRYTIDNEKPLADMNTYYVANREHRQKPKCEPGCVQPTRCARDAYDNMGAAPADLWMSEARP